MNAPFSIACFDMDGTLTTIPSSAFLGQVLGYGESAEHLERRYAAGEITNWDVATADAEHFRGRSKREIWAVLDGLPRVAGIGETVERLHQHGLTVLVTTVAWTFVAEYFQDRCGFDGFCGCEMRENAAGCLTGEVVRHFDEYDKARFVEEYCRSRGISLGSCAAVGDSRSDLPLFAQVGRAIAFNATPAARAAAHVSFDGTDLRVVLGEILSAD